MPVNERLRFLRKKKDKTQTDVARDLNLHVSQYNMIENGRRSPSLEVALRIARYFETDVESLFSGEEFHIKSKRKRRKQHLVG